MNLVMKRFIIERLNSDYLNLTTYRDVFSEGFKKKSEDSISFITKMVGKYGDEAIDFYSDEYAEVEGTKLLFYKLCIIALYMDIEMCLKEVAVYLFNAEKKTMYRFDDIKRSFEMKGITIAGIVDYNIINELRELNNCIKHNGYVSEKLATINKSWVKDTEIKANEKHIDYFEKGLSNFKLDLHSKLHEYLCNSI